MGIPKYIINCKDSGGGGGAADLSVSITHSELKALRDGGNLAPGTWYRITDYQTTIPPNFTADVHSAGHLFDVIVRADDDRHLNENAYAAHHGGDAYFAGCKLEAWELKYCIDNDTDRFQLAYAGGKGVIYWMKDEFGNECPYDFKNIMFSRPMTGGEYDPEGEDAYAYTFNIFMSGIAADATVAQAAINQIQCFGNKIKESYINSKMAIKDNVFLLGAFDNSDIFACKHNSIGFNGGGNTLSTGSGNQLGDGCCVCLLGEDCGENRIEADCVRITLLEESKGNTFGFGCEDILIEKNCMGNQFGAYCDNIQLQKAGSSYNHFGNFCTDIEVSSSCSGMTVFDYAQDAYGFGGGNDNIEGCQVMGGNYRGGKITFRPGYPGQVAGIDGKGNLIVFNPADLPNK
jgi:hypothetical protein